jgi:hypothetical protein
VTGSAPVPEDRSAPAIDLEVRPHLTPYFAYAAAFLIAAAHITVGFLLKIRSSGVIFQTADQVAIGLLGVIIGGLVLMFARPRLRVGPDGLSLRNLLGYRLIPWSEVDEYIPLMAIQSVDKERAVDAMDAVRRLFARYRPDVNRPSATS